MPLKQHLLRLHESERDVHGRLSKTHGRIAHLHRTAAESYSKSADEIRQDCHKSLAEEHQDLADHHADHAAFHASMAKALEAAAPDTWPDVGREGHTGRDFRPKVMMPANPWGVHKLVPDAVHGVLPSPPRLILRSGAPQVEGDDPTALIDKVCKG